MPVDQLKSKQVLHEYLNKKARENNVNGTIFIPAKYSRYSPDVLFRQFKIANMDKYGNFSCAYGEYGKAIGVSVGVDIGAILAIANPALAWFSFTVEGEAKIERLKETMVVLQQVVPLRNQRPTVMIGNRKLWKERAWETQKPIALMPFIGSKKEHKGTLSFDFTVQLIPLTPLEGYHLATDLKIGSINVTMSISRQNFAWGTDMPRWYTDYVDPNMSLDFKNFIGESRKITVKKEFIGWLQYVRSIINKMEGEFLVNLKKELKDLPHRRFQGGKSMMDRLKNTSTEDFLKKTDKIIAELAKVVEMPWQGNDIYITSDREEIKVQLEWFQKALKKARDEEAFTDISNKNNSHKGIPALYYRNAEEWFGMKEEFREIYKKLCFASLSLWNPELNGEFGLSLKPEILGKKEANAPEVGTEVINLTPLSVGAGYSIKYATSRYQSFALPKRNHMPLVFTQDSYIRYNQWWFDVSTSAKLLDNLFALHGDDLRKSKKILINKLHYTTVSAFWVYHKTKDSWSTLLRPGSGLSFGTHIRPSKLEEHLNSLAKNDKKEAAWSKVKYYADRLQMSKDEFLTFAEELKTKIEGDSENWKEIKKNYREILIESAFRFENASANIKNGKLQNMLEKFKIYFENDANVRDTNHIVGQFTLESVRLRVRMEDHRSGPSNSFKLGVIGGPVTLAIKFSKVNRAGHEGIWEYFYHPTSGEVPNTPVPPVFLIPHTFQ